MRFHHWRRSIKCIVHHLSSETWISDCTAKRFGAKVIKEDFQILIDLWRSRGAGNLRWTAPRDETEFQIFFIELRVCGSEGKEKICQEQRGIRSRQCTGCCAARTSKATSDSPCIAGPMRTPLIAHPYSLKRREKPSKLPGSWRISFTKLPQQLAIGPRVVILHVPFDGIATGRAQSSRDFLLLPGHSNPRA